MTEPAKNLAHGAQKVSQSSSPPAGVTRATGFGRAVTLGADKDEGALAAGGRDAAGLAGGRSAGLLTGLGRGRDAGAEGVFAETIKSHTTQEARGNNAVGVDIIAKNGESETFNLGDFCERHTILRK